MTAYQLHRKQWVPHPTAKVFEFFARAENLGAAIFDYRERKVREFFP